MASKQTKPRTSATKKSIVAGGLIGTGGFFIAKAIGLLYAIPFSDILGSSAYMSYYGSAYRIYSYLLNVFTAGAPMAIATMVSKYAARKNWKTILTVQRMAPLIMMLLGLCGMLVMLALSAVLAPAMADGTEQGTSVMIRVLCILSLAIFFVPILASYRGFIQGCREMEEYAYSQAFEQIFRVAFLLGVSCLVVYGFHLSSVYALYAAVASTSIAAIAGIIQIVRFSRIPVSAIQEQAKTQQKEKPVALKLLLREFILLCIPYLLFAVLGYVTDIFDAVLLPIGLKLSSMSSAQVSTVTSAVNYVGIKLTAIPMILAPGFTAAIIPHITAAIEEHDMKKVRKDILSCINIVLFISLFISFALIFYAQPIYYSLFYTDDLPLAADTLRWVLIDGLFGAITPIVTSMMMACGMRRKLLSHLAVSVAVRAVIMVPFTMWWGMAGNVIAGIIQYSYIIFYSLSQMSAAYGVHFKKTISILVRTAIGLVLMFLCTWLLSALGLGSVEHSKWFCLAGALLSGIVSALVFAAAVLYLKVPQELFHFRLNLGKARHV